MGKKRCSSRRRSRLRTKGGVRLRESHQELPQENRIPLSLDSLAFIASMDARAKKKKDDWLKVEGRKEKDYKGEMFEHPLALDAPGILYEAVHDMVYKLALGYTSSCREDVDDLAQDCMKRMMERIGDFNPEVAKFTTWSWRVCVSVLNRIYRRESGRNKHLILVDVSEIKGRHEPRVEHSELPALRFDIRMAAAELAGKYPKRALLIRAMFEGLTKDGFSSITETLTRASKRAGISLFLACEFFRDVIRPFFNKRFNKHFCTA